jgi:hypothetical protein
MEMRPPAWLGSCPMCRGPISAYTLVDAHGTALERLSSSEATIFGRVFAQWGRPGVAAYHFDAPGDCYLSCRALPGQLSVFSISHSKSVFI